MKVYLVQGHIEMKLYRGNFVEQDYLYGIFSSEEKANVIANELKKNILERDEQEKVTITPINVDEPTEDYYLMTDD